MVTALAVTARVLAAVAAIVAGIGLWACLAAEARLWGPDAPVPASRRWITAPWFASPHVVGLVAAVVARRSVRSSVLALAGVALNTWISYTIWAYDGHTRTSLVLTLMQAWMNQVLVCSLPIAGAVTAWRERRKNHSAAGAAPEVSSG